MQVDDYRQAKVETTTILPFIEAMSTFLLISAWCAMQFVAVNVMDPYVDRSLVESPQVLTCSMGSGAAASGLKVAIEEGECCIWSFGCDIERGIMD